MLLEIAARRYHSPTDKKFGPIPRPWAPWFSGALSAAMRDEAVLGEANEAIEKERDAMDFERKAMDFERQNAEYEHENALDKTWNEGVETGYKYGVDAGSAAARLLGKLDGLNQGWSDASGFKEPYRVYDLAAGGLVPMAKAASPEALADAVEDTRENTLFRATTNLMAKKGGEVEKTQWNKNRNEPFVYDPIHKRLGINLDTLTAGADTLEGKKAVKTGNNATNTKRITKTKNQLAEIIVGKAAKTPGPPKLKRPVKATETAAKNDPLLIKYVEDAPDEADVEEVESEPEDVDPPADEEPKEKPAEKPDELTKAQAEVRRINALRTAKVAEKKAHNAKDTNTPDFFAIQGRLEREFNAIDDEHKAAIEIRNKLDPKRKRAPEPKQSPAGKQNLTKQAPLVATQLQNTVDQK